MRIIIEYTKMNIKKILAYKMDFFLKIISVLIWIFTGLFNIYILSYNFNMLSDWSFAEVKLLYSIWALSFGIYNAFGNAVRDIEKLIITGKMDCYLIKPVDPLIQIAFSKINMMGIGFILFGLISGIVSLCKLHIFSLPKLIFLIVCSILGGILIFSIYLIFACTSFFWGRSNKLLTLGYDLHKFTQYPLDIYNKVIFTALTLIIPFGFSNYYPVKYYLGKTTTALMPLMCIFVPVFVAGVAYMIWRISLSYYEGSGS